MGNKRTQFKYMLKLVPQTKSTLSYSYLLQVFLLWTLYGTFYIKCIVFALKNVFYLIVFYCSYAALLQKSFHFVTQ